MLSKIEKIRKQSPAVRNRYAFWCALLFTAVITVFWVSSLPARVQILAGVAPAPESEGGFSRVWQNMKASVLESMPQPVPPPEDVGSQELRQITIDEFMASTTPRKKPAPQGRPILIGTSTVTAQTATSS